jgi:hypothetical protein
MDGTASDGLIIPAVVIWEPLYLGLLHNRYLKGAACCRRVLGLSFRHLPRQSHKTPAPMNGDD